MSNLLEQASLVMIPSGYAEDVVYSEIPLDGSGDLTWTRASNGTRVNSAGLVEVCPWNLLTYSEEFNNAIWTKITASVTANTTTAPNGTFTADSLIANVAVYGLVQQTANITANVPNTFSVYAKYNGISSFQLQTRDNANNANVANVAFDILTGVISTAPSASGAYSNASATIESVGNGWYRLSLTSTSNISVTSRFRLVSDLSDGINGYFIWGAQMVEGATAKPYFPTTDRLNVPRLTYQNGGGGCPSLLLEPQRTNLALYSEQINNPAFWAITNSGTISANNEISPDGTQNADTLTAGANFSQVQGSIIGTIGTVYTVSIYVKRISGTGNVFLRAVENANTLISVTNEWQRFTATVTSTTIIIRIGIQLATSGDAVAIWGGQIEVGAYPTTYIPTTTASATRVVDSFSRNNIFTNGLITSSGGTWFVELLNNLSLTRDASDVGLFIGNSSNGTSGDVLAIRNNGTGRLAITKRVSGTQTGLYDTTTDTTKVAIKWNGSTADVFVNGTKVVSATSFAATNMEFLNGLGADVTKFISQMDLFPTPLTDAECIALTTL
jgi:hypothetical protein